MSLCFFLCLGDFWLGLEKMHQMVKEERFQLLVELRDWEGNTQRAHFLFRLGGEETAYTLSLLGPIRGELESAMGDFPQLPFSTRDRDHDLKGDTNCAKHLSGQWRRTEQILRKQGWTAAGSDQFRRTGSCDLPTRVQSCRISLFLMLHACVDSACELLYFGMPRTLTFPVAGRIACCSTRCPPLPKSEDKVVPFKRSGFKLPEFLSQL